MIGFWCEFSKSITCLLNTWKCESFNHLFSDLIFLHYVDKAPLVTKPTLTMILPPPFLAFSTVSQLLLIVMVTKLLSLLCLTVKLFFRRYLSCPREQLWVPDVFKGVDFEAGSSFIQLDSLWTLTLVFWHLPVYTGLQPWWFLCWY